MFLCLEACLGAQVLVPRLTTVRPRSVRTFHMEEDGLGTIPADVMVKLPSEVRAGPPPRLLCCLTMRRASRSHKTE